MSGIRCGSRLEQLLDLRRQIDLQIEVERRKDPAAYAAATAEPAKPKPPALNATDRLLAELGVTSTDVKVWAVEQGLLVEVSRGRVGINLVEQYARAHRQEVSA